MTKIKLFQPQSKDGSIAPEQLRAARGLLGWSRNELAKKAGTSAETIKNIEHKIYEPKEETTKALIDTLSQQGIEFVCHKASVAVPAGIGENGRTVTFSYSGIIYITASVSESAGGVS
jgi:DNA-binding XRE family transcriptional regulator